MCSLNLSHAGLLSEGHCPSSLSGLSAGQQQHVLFSVYVLCSDRLVSWGRRDRFGYRFYKVECLVLGFVVEWSEGEGGVEML